MANIKIWVENNMINFQQTGNVQPYGRANIEARYTDTQINFYHTDKNYLKEFDTINNNGYFLFSEIQDQAGTPIGATADLIRIYLSDKIGNFKQAGGSGTALSTTVSTTNFNNNLSPLDTDVQKALDTIDDLVITGGGGDVHLDVNFSNSPISVLKGRYYNIDTTGGDVIMILPLLSTVTNFKAGFSKDDASVNKVILRPTGTDIIVNDNADYTLTLDDEGVEIRGYTSKYKF